MPKRKKHASADGGGEAAGEGATGRSGGVGGTSTTGSSAKTFSLNSAEQMLKAKGFRPMTAAETASSAKHFTCGISTDQPTNPEFKASDVNHSYKQPKAISQIEQELMAQGFRPLTSAESLASAKHFDCSEQQPGPRPSPAANGSNPHRGSTFEADALGLSRTGVRPVSHDQAPATTPSVALATVEQQEAFAEAVVEHEGIKPAARAWGLKSSAVFFHASTHPDFRKILNAAQGAVFESQVYKLDELCNKLLTMEPREMNQCANAYGRVFDYRMRIVGKLLPVIYGDKPGTQVNIQNNTGIVCTEEQREKLIQMNQKLLTARGTITNQE